MVPVAGVSMSLTTFSSFEIPPTATYVDVVLASSQYMVVGQFHDLTDGVLLMHGVIRAINGNVVTFENIPRDDGDVGGLMNDGNVDKDAHAPIVTPLVAGIVPAPTNDVRDVLLGTGIFGRLRDTPLEIDLHETDFVTLDAWLYVFGPMQISCVRSEQTLIQVALSLHFMWTAGAGSQAYCDWSADGTTHYRRTYHSCFTKKTNTDVNDIDLSFWIPVTPDSNLNATIGIQGRQHAGPLGLSVVGLETTAYPEMQSKAIIFDGGPM
jgi:hypothetical protein